ncbi:MAG: tRNA uridine-5-carboxymethylaminomethyl(34) synthesis GTPase MnmE [Burkholderiaceae bacterium]
MLARHADPIAAIATAPGRGAVGMVRVSGQSVQAIIDALCGKALKAREATYLPFLAADGSAIDQGLALHFPAPHSYTGEDVLELQAHGGPVVLQLLLARCLEAGKAMHLRVAAPGEFTERAFLNDKIDLAQAEAIADLIDASTEAAARSASRSLAGVFSRQVHSLRDALIHLRMLVEATLDFPEEEIDHLRKADAGGQLLHLQQTNAELLQKTQQGALLREGIKVVIAGQPNAGKSSLLNALAGAELAIVTPIAGTTRDKVQQTIQIEGVPLHIIDTAGLRDSTDEVERIGIARAWDEIAGADAVLHLHDLAATHHADPQIATKTIAADDLLTRTIAGKVSKNIPVVQIWNKLDAVPEPLARQHLAGTPEGSASLTLSAKTGHGIEPLRQKLLQIAGWQSATEGIFIARARHVQALQDVQRHLATASELLAAQTQSLDLLAEELRLAQNALGSITGEFSADDLLGEIFSRFCIGK